MSDDLGSRPEITLRNLVRDRTSGSLDQLKDHGGPEGIVRKLGISQTAGVDLADVESRRQRYGTNAPTPPETTTYFEFLWEAFSDFTVLMLVAAAVVSLVLAFAYEKTSGSYAEGFAILASVLIVTNVTAINDYSKQKQFQKLNAAVEDTSVRCVRNGQVEDVKAADLVVGDIVQLAVGDMFSADGLFLRGDNVATDESALTGEPKLCRKDCVRDPFLLSGTKVMEGSGLFVVIAVGVNSEAGQIRELVRTKRKSSRPAVQAASATTSPAEDGESHPVENAEAEKSVLEAKLDRIAITVGKIATVIAVVALIVMCVRFAIETFAITDPNTVCASIWDASCSSQEAKDFAPDTTTGFNICGTSGFTSPCCQDTSTGSEIIGSPCPWLKNHLSTFLEFLITAITILVVAVPEGLPLAVTLSLAFSVRRMQSENNLVKHLDACETMGSATTICSDKTGTLTKNRMTVVASMVGVDSGGNRTLSPSLPAAVKESLVNAICLSGSSDIVWTPQLRLWDQIGSKTECALLQTIKDNLEYDKSYTEVRAERSSLVVKKFPFSSAAKKSAFLIRTNNAGTARLYLSGASEIVLDACANVVDCETVAGAEGGIVGMTPGMRKLIETKINEFAQQAMRTVCLAYKDVPESSTDEVTADEIGLTFLCLVGIEDPLRDEVPAAIAKCNRAGVDVKMVTGDNINTAVAIARKCGIIRASDIDPLTGNLKPNVAMTGPEFRQRALNADDGSINQSELDLIWPHLRVLARSSPTDKYTLVSGMMASTVAVGPVLRQVVAVTGDGTNDAPALKKADVGFAMGITGTAVARDAADIIVLDDNFASIVIACKWGRNVFDSIQKFLQFQLTVNIVAVTIAIEGAFIYNKSPIGAVQMLWVNLIMDALASLALATEPPTEALLDRPPHGKDASAITTTMIWNIVGQAVFQLLILNGIYFGGPSWFDIESGNDSGDQPQPSEHYTLMFNALVLMQLTNQINSRKLAHELNVFEGLASNMYFVVILLAETVLQVLFVQFGGTWVDTAALSGYLWGISIAVSIGSFPMYWLIVAVKRFVDKRQLQRKLSLKSGTTPPVEQEMGVIGDLSQPANVRTASVVASLPDLPRPVLGGVVDQELGLGYPTEQAAKPALQKSDSRNLRSLSTKNLRDLVSVPDVDQLRRTASGGFKNPKRQAATHQRLRNMFLSSDKAREEFKQAAREFRESSSSLGKKDE